MPSALLATDGLDAKASLLKKNRLLSQLDRGHLEELAETSRWLTVKKSQVLWLTGSEVRWFGLIESGYIKMVRTSEAGREATLEIMGPRQTFGCLGAVEGSGCPLSAVAITDGQILRVPKSEFLVAYESSRTLQKEMLKVSARRFFAKLDLMASLTTGRVEGRIASVLLMLSESYGVLVPEGVRLEVPLTRQDISDFTGITLESTIRTLSSWQKQGLVASNRSMVTILNSSVIEEFVRGA